MIDFRQRIGGDWVDAVGGGSWDLINPATEELIEQIPFGDGEDAYAAIDAATDAFPGWSRLTAYDRGAILEKAAAFIEANLDDFARITTEESGKPLAQSTAARRSASTGAGFLLAWPTGESTSPTNRWAWSE